MTLFPAVILAILQGITEFLPISSSSHLVITTKLFAWPDQGLVLALSVHIGTLFAVIAYFRHDIWEMLAGAAGAVAGRRAPGLRLMLYLFVATLPAVLVGYFGFRYLSRFLGSAEVTAWATLIFGLLLGLTDRLCMTVRRIEHMNYAGALFIGFVQILALIPGASRAGIAMTGCRILGMERRDSARFAILLSIPAILGAAVLTGLELYRAGESALRLDAALATGLSFVTALFAIALMMRWLLHASFAAFVVYRVVLGMGLLYWVYS